MVDNDNQREDAIPQGQPLNPAGPTRADSGDTRGAPGVVGGAHGSYNAQSSFPSLQHNPPTGPNLGQSNQSNALRMDPNKSPSALNMSMLAGALPDYQTPGNPSGGNLNQHNVFAGSANVIPAYQSAPFSGQLNASTFPVLPTQYHSPFQEQAAASGAFGTSPGMRHAQSGGPSPIHSGFPAPYYPGQHHHHQSQQQHSQHHHQHQQHHHHHHQQQQFLPFAAQFGHPGHVPYPAQFNPSSQALQHSADASLLGGRAHPASFGPGTLLPPVAQSQFLTPGGMAGGKAVSNSTGGSIPSTPRGPPRKPKQSGHALWVGNLPSGTVVGDLKDHFSKDATKDIESVFLISKSNCAFVNYRTEDACTAAMNRFHDSRFHGVRLVCRLRRSSAVGPGPGVPTGPAALMSPTFQAQHPREPEGALQEESVRDAKDSPATSGPNVRRQGEVSVKTPDKYFIMKSLTIEDMELSVRNSIWATQGHNEDALNKAFETTDNVYLIFSANKSGEYFGYAKMTSAIDEESAAELEWAPRGHVVTDDPDLPRSIPTPATEYAPRGRIIDDSARGTIFWEADLDDDEIEHVGEGEIPGLKQEEVAVHGDAEKGNPATTGDVQAFGRPFRIEWLNTTRLPFYRTRGLRNPWNANREVKIARDGTELETSVGRRLVQMFHRPPMEPPAAMYGPGRPF